MKKQKSNKEPEIIVDLSFDEMVELMCTTPKEKVDALIKKIKNRRLKNELTRILKRDKFSEYYSKHKT